MFLFLSPVSQSLAGKSSRVYIETRPLKFTARPLSTYSHLPLFYSKSTSATTFIVLIVQLHTRDGNCSFGCIFHTILKHCSELFTSTDFSPQPSTHAAYFSLRFPGVLSSGSRPDIFLTSTFLRAQPSADPSSSSSALSSGESQTFSQRVHYEQLRDRVSGPFLRGRAGHSVLG